MKRNDSRALPVILLAIFLDLVTNGILIPIVPQLLANPGSPYYLLPPSVPISYAYVILGFLIAILPIFLFFATPILGEYSDYVGRRKVMTLALTGTGISLGLFAVGVMVKSLTLLFIARILGGIMGGNLSVAQAAMADITPPVKRAERFGLVGAAYGFGFIIGPVIGAILSDRDIVSWFTASTPFWFAAGLSIVNAILVYFFLADTRTREADEPVAIDWTAALTNIFSAYKMKRIRAIFATNFLFQAGLALFATFFAVFLTTNFGFNQTDVGYFIAYAGVCVIISQGFLLRVLTRWFDEVQMLRVFLIIGAITLFLFYVSYGVTALIIVGALFALTNGISMAALPALVSRRASARNQGEVMGVNGSVQALAQAIPPILAGFLAADLTAGAPIYIAAVVIGVGWIFFMLTVKREN